MALPFVLIAALAAVAAAPAVASDERSFTAAVEEARSASGGEPQQAPSAQVDAPATLPLFAGALALLGWRLGRRRRR